MRPRLGVLPPTRRAFSFSRPGMSDLSRSRSRFAVAAATGVTLTYLYFPFDRPIALDSRSPVRHTRSIWADDPPTEAKPTSSSDPEPRSTDSDESGESEQASGNEGAFNPETGEINWDCSCLGGMAHGPCGPEFREAFSCFVFSEKEPKGVDCVEKFKNMQDCFRRHPDVYGEELDDDDDAEGEGAREAVAVGSDPAVSSPEDEAHPVTASSSGPP